MGEKRGGLEKKRVLWWKNENRGGGMYPKHISKMGRCGVCVWGGTGHIDILTLSSEPEPGHSARIDGD